MIVGTFGRRLALVGRRIAEDGDVAPRHARRELGLDGAIESAAVDGVAELEGAPKSLSHGATENESSVDPVNEHRNKTPPVAERLPNN
tara:strand:+ start:4804 stop:5067 length:264 start_codon:yes stop_codon:yes gene_type:complete